jgi:aspartate/methionine/tyrosine aminotransferase
MTVRSTPAGTAGAYSAAPQLPQASFDDLYSATYAILDDAKTDHDLVKLYKGSHGSPDPHPVVTSFGEFFFRTRRGLIAYASEAARLGPQPSPAGLDCFDAGHRPRVPTRAAFELLAAAIQRPGETPAGVLNYVVSRTHHLGAYRGGSSGYEDEAQAFAAAHFRSTGLATLPGQVLIFSGGAKGAFMAFCAALMCRRNGEDLHHLGGLLLTPAGYYQSLRLIPPIFGGDIHVTGELTGTTVSRWLDDTGDQHRRCIYVPLVNNADGQILTPARARSIARAVLEHNITHPGNPVHVLSDDVYTGSYLSPGCQGLPIAAVTGAGLGDPALGRMSDWTLSVVTASKTFALPTARVAFATSTSPALLRAVAHYRTVLSQGRVPQVTELAAAAAICLTPQDWIEEWNIRYRTNLAGLTTRVGAVNAIAGFDALHIDAPGGGWYLPLRISPALVPGATSSVDAFAALLHYGGANHDSGIAVLPGELFGYRAHCDGFLLRGTLAASEHELRRFTARLHAAVTCLTGPDGPAIAGRAMKRARAVAGVDAILARCRY